MEIDKHYKGREHSAIKHELLRSYLEKMLFIIAVSGFKEITYVDCFAGPWSDESEDLHVTSIAVSLDKIIRVGEGLAVNNKANDVQFRVIYVEEQMSLLPIEDSDLRNQFAVGIEDVKQFWMGHLSSAGRSRA